MRLTDRVREMIRSFLNIQPAPNIAFTIQETMDFQANAFKNAVWFRGDSEELSQLYKQLPGKTDSFWASVPSENHGLRKIHTGLPSIIVRVLADIVLADLNEPVITPAGKELEWKEVARENRFDSLLSQAVQKALYLGDGAFKVNFERGLSERPILEFYGADGVEFTLRHGRTVETRFYTELDHAGRKYQLCEAYGMGYIKYTLADRITGHEIELSALPQTAGLTNLEFDNSACLAVPFRIFHSSKWEGRGKSVYEEKTDSFDALDEAWSQWMDALRSGRAKEYIPNCLIPRDPRNGTTLTPNRFDNRFIEVQAGFSENGEQPQVKVVQPVIPHESYLATYITALDLCMQGLVSPSTLGIDVKKLDNAEAQREKEKATLYTRGAIVDALRETLPKIICAALQAEDIQGDKVPEDVVSLPEPRPLRRVCVPQWPRRAGGQRLRGHRHRRVRRGLSHGLVGECRSSREPRRTRYRHADILPHPRPWLGGAYPLPAGRGVQCGEGAGRVPDGKCRTAGEHGIRLFDQWRVSPVYGRRLDHADKRCGHSQGAIRPIGADGPYMPGVEGVSLWCGPSWFRLRCVPRRQK